MHKALIVLALACATVTAQAAIVATMANEAGGSINLTDRKSVECGSGRRVAFAMHPAGDVIVGCWTFIEEKIHIRYEQGTNKMHEFGDFKWKQINQKGQL